MKKGLVLGALLSSALLLSSCGGNTVALSIPESGNGSEAANVLTEVKTTQFFTDEKVASEDIEKILAAGVNAPSAMNTQPWHFTAITDEETNGKLKDAMGSMKPPAGGAPKAPEGGEAPKDAPKAPEGKGDFAKIANKAGMGDAPLTIVISCEEGAELSAGLAVQNMAAEAQLLGYGTKIMTSPTMALNGDNKDEFKALLSIPENQSAAAVLLVGKADSDNPDAESAATERNAFEEVTTVIGE
ncbi:MAG: nitroreductase family protein [Clostridia bacterium]|nr:nitroreductase family protein [Clostridia bacterium]